jgi:hypothetical protein
MPRLGKGRKIEEKMALKKCQTVIKMANSIICYDIKCQNMKKKA